MRPLVAVRRAAPFDPRFSTRDELFWPLARAASALAGCHEFPTADLLQRVFEGPPPVRFVAAAPRKRRRTPVEARELYDARITLDREVPTRTGCWHDFLNALVWGTFPLAKRALHARQYRAIRARLAPGARTLPPTRTPELDALALLDEGGVVLLSSHVEGAAPRTDAIVVFGHAIYESLVLGVAPAVVAGIALAVDGQPTEIVPAVDKALARVIEDPTKLQTPSELRRVGIRGAFGGGLRTSANQGAG